jgi:acetyltransferase
MRDKAGQALDEYEAKALLRAYGIATSREQRVHSPEQAVAAATAIGYPVAVKVCSPEVIHKSEAGGVHLNLPGPQAVAEACRAIGSRLPQASLLVSEMVAGDREFMAGVVRPPGFPACVLFALGGVWAEALPQRAVRLVPFGQHQARALIASLKVPGLLRGARGRAPVDTDALADILLALGHIVLDFPDLREIDLNPIVICAGRPVVVDALLLR